MTICQRCHRPLKHPTESGFGPVCLRAMKSVSWVDPDLFGFDIDQAALAAQARLVEFVNFQAWMARHAVSDGFNDARKRMGVLP